MVTDATTLQTVGDFLNRTAFLSALRNHVKGIAEIPIGQLPAPRVIAVDAPWGYGKSWIAERFREQLQTASKDRPVAFIDAFRYDHHDDVFAVIAAVVMDALNPKGATKTRYLKAAKALLKVGAPALVKGLAKAGMKKVGIDPEHLSAALETASNASIEGAGKFSEKAVEQLFEHYAKTRQLQEDFQHSLNDLTIKLEEPFVVIIDELDRCRPSFALEVLERIKHLFSADNVVFVLFWNSESIHESIRHTYGRETAAEAYLSKFIALSIPLVLPEPRNRGSQSEYSSFIERELGRVLPDSNYQPFDRSLAILAVVFNASLRDVQKAISIFRLVILSGADWPSDELAYLTLLYVTNFPRYRRVLNRELQPTNEELDRFPTPDPEKAAVGPTERIWSTLKYRSQANRYDELAAKQVKGENVWDDMVITELGLNQRASNAKNWLDQTGVLIDSVLSTDKFSKRKKP